MASKHIQAPSGVNQRSREISGFHGTSHEKSETPPVVFGIKCGLRIGLFMWLFILTAAWLIW